MKTGVLQSAVLKSDENRGVAIKVWQVWVLWTRAHGTRPGPLGKQNCQSVSPAFCLKVCSVSSVCHCLIHHALKTVICDSVLSCSDYCNWPLDECPKNLVCKLQTMLPPSWVILLILTSDPLACCHVQYKITILTFKFLNNQVPSYSLISLNWMFCLANSTCLPMLESFIFHLLVSSLLVDHSSLSSTINLEQCTLLSSSFFFYGII